LRRRKAESQPAGTQLRRLDFRLSKKKRQFERGEAATAALEKPVQDAQHALSEYQGKQTALRQEVAALEAEIAAVAGRVAGPERPASAGSLAQALRHFADEELQQPELQRALSFAAAVLQGAKQVASLRVQAAEASGSSALPVEESATPEESRLVQEVREHHRQLSQGTELFQESFGAMQLRMADAQSRLAAFQRARAATASGAVAAAGMDGAPPGGGGGVGSVGGSASG